VPGERPQSLLLALDPFKLLYDSNTNSGGLLDGKIEELTVNRGQAVVVSSFFCHSGGSNYTINEMGCVYQLFTYIVSSKSDYPSMAGTMVKH
jgi:hypothetical protein